MSSHSASTTIATIGIDLGKNTFHLVGLDRRGAIVSQLKLSRGQIERRLANVPPCLIGMEACSGSHHIGRRLTALGHDVRLIPAQYVKPFLKGHKNDYRDAEAIAEAVQRPTMRFVAIKSIPHRVRVAASRPPHFRPSFPDKQILNALVEVATALNHLTIRNLEGAEMKPSQTQYAPWNLETRTRQTRGR